MNSWYIVGANHWLWSTRPSPSPAATKARSEEGSSVKARRAQRRSAMPGTATPTPTERSQARVQRSDPGRGVWLAGSDLKPIPAESPPPPHDDAVRRLEGALAEQGRR